MKKYRITKEVDDNLRNLARLLPKTVGSYQLRKNENGATVHEVVGNNKFNHYKRMRKSFLSQGGLGIYFYGFQFFKQTNKDILEEWRDICEALFKAEFPSFMTKEEKEQLESNEVLESLGDKEELMDSSVQDVEWSEGD